MLSDISPHQSPESLSDNTGLGHYLESLERIGRWRPAYAGRSEGIRTPVRDLAARIDAIRLAPPSSA